jgi:hypothetical protein
MPQEAPKTLPKDPLETPQNDQDAPPLPNCGGELPYWAVLGRSWAVLGRSWAVLGRSWVALGSLLGGVWAVLGRYWVVLGRLGACFVQLVRCSRPWACLFDAFRFKLLRLEGLNGVSWEFFGGLERLLGRLRSAWDVLYENNALRFA